MSKKLAMLGLSAALVSSTVYAADYDNHWAKAAIDKWSAYKVVVGYENGDFRPNNPITRAELAAILTRVFNLQDTTGAPTYVDVFINPGIWYEDAVSKVSALGLMHIEGVFFEPNQPATREEAAYALAKAYQIVSKPSENTSFADEETVATWSKEAVDSLVQLGYISGHPDGTFKPQGTLTRAELVTMLENMTEQLISKEGTYTNSVKGNVVVNTKGVTLKDMTIEGNLYLTQGLQDDDVTLENVKVTGSVYINGGKVRMSGDFQKVELASMRAIELTKGSIKELVVNKPGSTLVVGSEAVIEVLTQNQVITLEGKGQVAGQGVGNQQAVSLAGAGIYINGEYVALPTEGDTIILDVPTLSQSFNRSDILNGLVIEASMEGATVSSTWGSMKAGQMYSFKAAEEQLGLIKEVALGVGTSPSVLVNYILGTEPLTIGSLMDDYANAQIMAEEEGMIIEDQYNFERYMSHASGKTSHFVISLRLK